MTPLRINMVQLRALLLGGDKTKLSELVGKLARPVEANIGLEDVATLLGVTPKRIEKLLAGRGIHAPKMWRPITAKEAEYAITDFYFEEGKRAEREQAREALLKTKEGVRVPSRRGGPFDP